MNHFSIPSWCLVKTLMRGRQMLWSSLWSTWTCSWRSPPTWPPRTLPSQTSPSWPRWPSWRAWTTGSLLTRKISSSKIINLLLNLFHFRNLYKWVERLKAELPYYESCNTGSHLNHEYNIKKKFWPLLTKTSVAPTEARQHLHEKYHIIWTLWGCFTSSIFCILSPCTLFFHARFKNLSYFSWNWNVQDLGQEQE